jgi:muramidase (phage lysozyme)
LLESENPQSSRLKQLFWLVTSGVVSLFLMGLIYLKLNSVPSQTLPSVAKDHPLVMEGGDPYLRALMRTISYSESNDANPYHIIYGGDHVQDLSQHPEKCVPIPHQSLCSTASGRYQFLNQTWYEKAQKYHPHPTGMLWWKNYSFEPIYQDQVMYQWLKDPQAWGFNIAQRLRNKEEAQVFCDLSPTWTSLPCGKEPNINTKQLLTQVYPQRLKEECAKQPDQC